MSSPPQSPSSPGARGASRVAFPPPKAFGRESILAETDREENPSPTSTSYQYGPIYVSETFRACLVGVYICAFLEVIVNAYTDPIYSDELSLHLLTFCFQLLSVLASALTFYLLLTDTFLVKQALYGRVLEEFRAFFLVTPAYLLLFFVTRLYRLALLYSDWPHLAIWTAAGYYPLYVLQKIGSLMYSTTLLRSTHFLLSEPRLFTPESVNKFT